MSKLSTENIRNVALVGHNGTGKTTLTEALLHASGAIRKKGSIGDKNTVSDFDPDEKERGHSIETGITHFDFGGKRINLLDCPGLPDFAAGAEEGMAACETALIAVSGIAGVEVMTRKLWGMATALEKPKMFVVTKMDHDRCGFDRVVAQLREVFGNAVAPLFIPVGEGAAFKGVIDLIDDIHDCPPDLEDKAKAMHAQLVESCVACDEAVMERYLNDEKISHADISRCFTKGLLAGSLVPVMCVSSDKDIGLKELLTIIAEDCPNPLDEPLHLRRKNPEQPSGFEERVITPKTDGPLYAQVFKSKRDPFIGKLSYLRVYSGALEAGGVAKSSSAPKPEKLAHFLDVQGKETKDKDHVVSGEIIALAKYETLNFGDTLTTDETGWEMAPIPMPKPMQSLAIIAKNRNDEAKVGQRLRAFAESDPTFHIEVDPQTHELVVAGLGQTHLDLMLARLKKQGIEVATKPPKIPYRSTVSGVGDATYAHKKQSGGAGQYGKCSLKVEPNMGNGFEFVDEIVGGVIPRQFIPSCEKGVTTKMTEGVWHGIPVVDVRVRLYDGKYHDVDSKDIAFQIAARECFKEAFEKARPQLIEPIVNLEVMVPGQYMGDITGHLSSHRGRIKGMDQLGDMQVVKAAIPAAEVQNYSSELKAITGGEGFYTIEFSHYDIVPQNIAAPVIAASKAHQVKEPE
ncbi:MAG TPA: elongation factor G [Planctomycetota bacterium]|nr:elongation factor G [Planctomycetota bacterium]